VRLKKFTHSEFDHNAGDFRKDPSAVYKLLHAAGVGQSEHYGGFWVVPTYETVQSVAHDTDTYSPADGTMLPGVLDRPLLPMESDPPLHGEYRRMLVKQFSPKAIREWVPAIRAAAQDLLKDVLTEEPYDFSLGYAKMLPTAIICQMLGVEFKTEFQEWVEDVVYRRISDRAATDRAIEKIHNLFRGILPERRENPGDDLVSLVLQAEIDGKPLDEETVIDFCFFLLIAGLDNTNFTIRALLQQLAIDHELRQRLVDDPNLIDAAVEEALRYFSPVIALGRTARADASLGGCPAHQGDKVLMLFGCANRDPAEFENPDEFDIDRFPNRHVAFGVGPHRCLGSNLARAEIAVAIEEVLKVLPDFELAGEVDIRWDDLGPLLIKPRKS
jgi:cytochrome P450